MRSFAKYIPAVRVPVSVLIVIVTGSMVPTWATGLEVKTDAAVSETITAASCAAADVDAAVDLANDGDTVVIPIGTCSWTSGLSVNKGVHIKGAVAGEVVLIHDAGTDYLFEITEDDTHLTEISNLKFVEGTGTADGHLAVYPGGRPVLLHHCFFETDGGLLRSIRWVPNRGVIWGNEFFSNEQDDQAIVIVNNNDLQSWQMASTISRWAGTSFSGQSRATPNTPIRIPSDLRCSPMGSNPETPPHGADGCH